jgi:hypothetical protein
MRASKVNIYSYTAASNPYYVVSLAHRYGYKFEKDQPLNTVLEQLVSYEGEPVLMDIIENNPDKELFMEYFEKKFGKKSKNCNCDENGSSNKILEQYMNFTGAIQSNQGSENKSITNQTSLMVLAGAVLIAFAILSKN